MAVSNEEIIYIPDNAYGLVSRIKNMDGRLAYLKDWHGEIATFILNGNVRRFDGRDTSHHHRLRVVETKAGRQSRFDYDRYRRERGEMAYRTLVKETPPRFPKSITLGSSSRRASTEWAALAGLGQLAEAKDSPGRDLWRGAQPKVIAECLEYLTERKAVLDGERDELRDELTALALEREWVSGMRGKADGRLILKDTRPTRELRDPELAKRLSGSYFTTTAVKGSVSVRMYATDVNQD